MGIMPIPKAVRHTPCAERAHEVKLSKRFCFKSGVNEGKAWPNEPMEDAWDHRNFGTHRLAQGPDLKAVWVQRLVCDAGYVEDAEQDEQDARVAEVANALHTHSSCLQLLRQNSVDLRGLREQVMHSL